MLSNFNSEIFTTAHIYFHYSNLSEQPTLPNNDIIAKQISADIETSDTFTNKYVLLYSNQREIEHIFRFVPLSPHPMIITISLLNLIVFGWENRHECSQSRTFCPTLSSMWCNTHPKQGQISNSDHSL